MRVRVYVCKCVRIYICVCVLLACALMCESTCLSVLGEGRQRWWVDAVDSRNMFAPNSIPNVGNHKRYAINRASPHTIFSPKREEGMVGNPSSTSIATRAWRRRVGSTNGAPRNISPRAIAQLVRASEDASLSHAADLLGYSGSY
jgi:hypothetical protein